MKIGGDLRMNRSPPRSGEPPARLFKVPRRQHGHPHRYGRDERYANTFASFLLDVPQSIERGLVSDVVHKAGVIRASSPTFTISGRSRNNVTSISVCGTEYYTPLVG
jgi:hypothetical protein